MCFKTRQASTRDYGISNFNNLVQADLLLIQIRTIQVNLKTQTLYVLLSKKLLADMVSNKCSLDSKPENEFLCGFYPQSLKGQFMNLLLCIEWQFEIVVLNIRCAVGTSHSHGHWHWHGQIWLSQVFQSLQYCATSKAWNLWILFPLALVLLLSSRHE